MSSDSSSHDTTRGSVVPTVGKLAEAIDAFLDLIDRHDSYVVVSHASPDGDAIGSTVAMGLLLEELGKDVVYFNVDSVPYNYQFLPGVDRLTDALPGGFDPDVTILLDCAEPSRPGDVFPEAGWAETIVVVDHHKTGNADFADLYVQDESAAATGELIFRIAARADLTITPQIAENLYCCLMTDTGSFRYSNTSQTTFRIAGELIDAGVDPWRMTSEIYESEPRERLELLALVLRTLELSDCGRLAFLRIEREMFEQTKTTTEHTDGFINYARSIRGVEVATQLREEGDRDWRVSFRSRGNVDVSQLAVRFGGGGHHNAAGCRMTGDPEDVERQLSEALVDILDAPGAA